MKKDLEIVKALIMEMNATYKKSGLKHPEKADLDKNKKISSYEKKRGKAIEKNLKKEVDTPNPPTDYSGNPAIPGLGPIVHEEHEGQDHEVSMANNSLDSILWAANELKKYLGDQERDIPAWIQDHITNAENYILQAAKNFHDYGDEDEDFSDMDAASPELEPSGEEDMSLAGLMEEKKAPVKEMIKKVGSKYNVYSKKGKKLGSHPSKKKAQKQMAAIEISKQGK